MAGIEISQGLLDLSLLVSIIIVKFFNAFDIFYICRLICYWSGVVISVKCFAQTVYDYESFMPAGLDYADPKRKGNFVGKILLAASLTALCIIMLKQSPSFSVPSKVTLVHFRKILGDHLRLYCFLFFKSNIVLHDFLSSSSPGMKKG